MSKIKKYIITQRLSLLRDEKSVKRHIADNDYFGTVATILALLKHQITADSNKLSPQIEKSFANLEKDLNFLQKKYQITLCDTDSPDKKPYSNPKTRNKKIKPKGRLINQ